MIESDRPLVTFALFAYNQEKYIREAVEAALSQDYFPMEMIITDDFSNDSTFEIINEVVNKYTGKIKLIVEKNTCNTGLISQINRIMKMASGEFIVMAAGDDISTKNRTSILVDKWIKSGKNDCSIFTNAIIINDSGSEFGKYFNNPRITNNIQDFIKLQNCWVGGFSHGFSKRLYEKFGDITLETFQEDGAIAFRAILNDGIYYIPEETVYYRRHDNNSYNPNVYKKLRKIFQSEIGLSKGQIKDLDVADNVELIVRNEIKRILKKKIIKNKIYLEIPGFIYILYVVKKMINKFKINILNLIKSKNVYINSR